MYSKSMCSGNIDATQSLVNDELQDLPRKKETVLKNRPLPQ